MQSRPVQNQTAVSILAMNLIAGLQDARNVTFSNSMCQERKFASGTFSFRHSVIAF